MKGLSRRNLFYARAFAAYTEDAVQRTVALLPWVTWMALLDKLEGAADRDWYAAAAIEHGWTWDVLAHQITSRLHARVGAAPSKFATTLPPTDSELAQAMVRDPYLLDFLDPSEQVAARDLEAALMDKLLGFLLELGHGFRLHRPPVPLRGRRR